MLREPLQRIASAYAHHHKGVGEACTRRGHDCHPDLTLLEYVQRPEVSALPTKSRISSILVGAALDPTFPRPFN